jgi:hypothetical protein
LQALGVALHNGEVGVVVGRGGGSRDESAVLKVGADLLHGPSDEGEWGLKLMRNVGEEPAFGLVQFAKAVGLLGQLVFLGSHLAGAHLDRFFQLVAAVAQATRAPLVHAQHQAAQA